MRSVWGSRVDRWFDQKTGTHHAGREDYDRAGIRWLVISVGIALVVALVWMIDRADDANF